MATSSFTPDLQLISELNKSVKQTIPLC